MALDQTTLALLAAVDAATNRIAARIQKLIDELAAAGNLTPEVNAALQAEVDKLNVLGADPDNPTPA